MQGRTLAEPMVPRKSDLPVFCELPQAGQTPLKTARKQRFFLEPPHLRAQGGRDQMTAKESLCPPCPAGLIAAQ